MDGQVTEAGVDAMQVDQITGEAMAEAVMRRRRKVQLIMDLETEDERQAVARAEKVLAAARADLEEKRAPYLAEVAKAEGLLFDWFAGIAATLPGTKTKKVITGGAWGEKGSGWQIGRGRVILTDEGVAAIVEASRIAEEITDDLVRIQSQVEVLGAAFPWLPEYCAETDLEGADAAIGLLRAMVKNKPQADRKAAGEILEENPRMACDALRLDNSATFILDGEKVTGAGTGKPLAIAWPPAPEKAVAE